MKVKCLANTGTGLPPWYFGKGYSPQNVFSVECDKEYDVYGMFLDGMRLSYLLEPRQDNRPFLYPAVLFVVTDPALPGNWYFAYRADEGGNEPVAVWGYREFLSQDHYEQLVERERDAMDVFAKRKAELSRTK